MVPKKETLRRATPRARKNRGLLVVASKVKAYVRSRGLNTSAEAISCLSDKVHVLLDQATARTSANGRKTLKPQDV
jgi:hypothetical protein